VASALERKIPASLMTLMREGFRVDRCFCYPLLLKNQVEGLFIFWGLDEKQLPPTFGAEFLLFQLCYQNVHYQKRVESLEITDPITELYNRNYFFKRLEEEIARARRLTKAVSVIKISVDHFEKLEMNLGMSNRDLILRSIALLVKKTSRTNDFACRTSEDEISLILPHCSRKGAAMRAERLRRAIENHSFAINGVHVTVSSGVSEYPTLSKSAEDLDVSSSEALQFIAGRGGNKVCLYKPGEDFKPDFDVPLT
jgi:diguanylate cyclase (GGDEF)-like protein